MFICILSSFIVSLYKKMSNKKLTQTEFITRASKVHNGKYNYYKTNYGKNNKQKVIIICPIHGEFTQTPDSHLQGKGCKKCAGVKLKTTHGMKFHPLYKRWDSMMQRCYNPKHISYKNYGARGIKVSDEFKDVKKYITYIESIKNYTPNTSLQVDRINNEGIYERGNLKLSNQSEQKYNTRIRNDNKTNYKGVARAVNSPRWRAYIYFNNKQISIGIFDNIIEAAKARDEYIIKNNLPHRLQLS